MLSTQPFRACTTYSLVYTYYVLPIANCHCTPFLSIRKIGSLIDPQNSQALISCLSFSTSSQGSVNVLNYLDLRIESVKWKQSEIN